MLKLNLVDGDKRDFYFGCNFVSNDNRYCFYTDMRIVGNLNFYNDHYFYNSQIF
ncbi:unnamed protein product [Nezara viridula]|uniref:Uncharacterized protein n=1 Tax=Nezara viridula TaxID=85310 RepID=A0A9P0EC13_NEZVI|nr:unnamed protein product [Nezara viridula]